MNATLIKPIKTSNLTVRNINPAIEAFNRGAILLDVRTIGEFDRSKISGARHCAYDQLPIFIDQIKNWNVPVIVYSSYGGRSRLASELLEKKNIEVIDGGSKTTLEELLF